MRCQPFLLALPLLVSACDRTPTNPTEDEFLYQPALSVLGTGAFSIELDATALTATFADIPQAGIPSFPIDVVQTILLDPGTYGLRAPGGSAPVVTIVVTATGTVDFSTDLDGLLRGRGTDKLTVLGLPITVDATALTSNTVFVRGMTAQVPPQVFNLTTLPGPYSVEIITGSISGGSAAVEFTVTIDGTVDFDTRFDGVLAGRGTPNLVVNGVTIEIDATALTTTSAFLISFNRFSTDVVAIEVTLPRIQNLAYTSVPSIAGAVFTISDDGKVDFAPSLDGILEGRGTSRLIANGAEIQIDARALEAPEFTLAGFFPSFATDAIHTLRLLPQGAAVNHHFRSTALAFDFTVIENGTVDYDPSLDDRVSGRGTSTLVVGLRDPVTLLEALIAKVIALELNMGIEKALSATLEAALASLENDRKAAIQQVEAFINQVEAMRGQQLTNPRADKLITDAQEVIAAIQAMP